ncbi:MAG: hypothetical protein HFI60_02675 [Lachnospiraceae bacterium]|nr:hypothetical protein [Lachnospiraceae bacterium]
MPTNHAVSHNSSRLPCYEIPYSPGAAACSSFVHLVNLMICASSSPSCILVKYG